LNLSAEKLMAGNENGDMGDIQVEMGIFVSRP
jgi:hypothetical protein